MSSYLNLTEKMVSMLHATFESLSVAGMISAAFWYAAAPIAPDGFQGPIATCTIAITSIVSLLLTIPLAVISYQKTSRRYIDVLNEVALELSHVQNNTAINLSALYHLWPKRQKDCFKNRIYALLSAIACTEVLLSIGWTIGSILIGVKWMQPLTKEDWLIFLCVSGLCGLVFGFVKYGFLSQQSRYQLLKEILREMRNISSVMP